MGKWLRAMAGAVALGLSAQVSVGLAQDAKAPAKAPAAAPSEAKGIAIVTPWARATPGGAKVGAAFMEIQAVPGADDKLLSASSPSAEVVELHDHVREGGVVKMRRIEALPIVGGKSVVLKPGGLHLMLMELKHPLKEGDAVDVTLVFEKAGQVKVAVPVIKIGSMGPPAGSDHGSGSGSGSGSKQ